MFLRVLSRFSGSSGSSQSRPLHVSGLDPRWLSRKRDEMKYGDAPGHCHMIVRLRRNVIIVVSGQLKRKIRQK